MISDLCIRRPVFTWVLVLIPVVLGIVSYDRLGVDLYPDVDFPVCSVSIRLPGASAEEIETSVTEPVEDIVNTIPGIDEMTSISSEGLSTVVIQFQLDKDIDVAAQEVRDKINLIEPTLPDDLEPPVVNKFENTAVPIMTIVVSGRRTMRETTEIARRQIKERLETVEGVGAVNLVGGRVRAMNIRIDPDRLVAYNLAITDVQEALRRQNLERPGGRVDQTDRELVIRTLGRLDTVEQFRDLIVTNRNGYPVRIRDLGTAEDSFVEPRSLARLDGENAVSLTIQRQSGTNAVEVASRIRERLSEIEAALPPDLQTQIIRDESRFIEKSIDEVQFHLILAAILVAATILLFIRDWRTTLIAGLSIPTSIVPSFAFMLAMGYTLDNITMLGLILAVGIVIDDAVVVHETIFRKMEEEGLSAWEASHQGTREIALPVLATSLSLVVIFVPLAFMGGIVGRFFSSFGLTVAFAILMSLFVSFTLTPMLCSRFLKLDPNRSGTAESKSGPIYRGIDGFFGGLLIASLRYKAIVVLVTILVVASTVPLAVIMGLALIPRDDQSEYEVIITTPEGYTLARTQRVIEDLEARLRALPGTQHIVSTIGQANNGFDNLGDGDVTLGSLYVQMTDLAERDYTQFAIQDQVREFLKEYPDLRTSVNDVSRFQGGRRGQQLQINIVGPDLATLAEYAETMRRRMEQLQTSDGQPALTDIDTTLSLRKPEIRVRIDREAASDLGIPIATIADTMRVLVGGLRVSDFKQDGETYDVWLRAVPSGRDSAADLYRMTLPSPTAGLVQLSSLAQLDPALGPSEINHYNRQRVVTILANPLAMSLGEATERMRQIFEDLEPQPGYRLVLSGQAKTLDETIYYFVIAFVLSVTFMYLILAAQFESWAQPVAILMALPVTIPFAMLSLILFNTSMDIYAMFGLFMLVGIVKKNGILQIDAANQLRAQGRPFREAILEANRTRLRPILMTTAMLVAAMIPIALGQGPGAGSRASLAKVIIGGQSLSLILALVVTPVTFEILEGIRARFIPRSSRERSGELDQAPDIDVEPSRSD